MYSDVCLGEGTSLFYDVTSLLHFRENTLVLFINFAKKYVKWVIQKEYEQYTSAGLSFSYLT